MPPSCCACLHLCDIACLRSLLIYSRLQAVVLALFPLHFFFQFLYYTDVASVAFVTSAHLVRTGMYLHSQISSDGSRGPDCHL